MTCDPGSDALTFDSDGNTVTIIGRNAQPGKYKAVFVLKTDGEEVYRLEFPYTLLPNHAPTVSLGSYKFDNITLNTLGVSVIKTKPANLGILFADEDGEELDVKVVNSNPEVATITEGENKFTIKSVNYGLASIDITATDGLGETATFGFMVAVKNPDKGSGAEISPEAASDRVNIWPATVQLKEYSIEVYSVSGAKVLSLTEKGGLFLPIEMDITGLAPGLYTAHVTPGGESTQKLLMKAYKHRNEDIAFFKSDRPKYFTDVEGNFILNKLNERLARCLK